MPRPLRAPFPWFGGKSRVADQVWRAFGDVPNYVEPFAGSLAVLLGRPSEPRIETVNDLDCYLANFWRAVQSAPDEVAEYADWPVNEADLHARHLWLVGREAFRERMKTDPEYFDARIAGWWVWGICQWIGSGWCSAPEWTGRTNAGRRDRGVHTAAHQQRPDLTASRGVLGAEPRGRDLAGAAGWKKRPSLGHAGRGVHRQLPAISGDSGASGRGIHASGLPKKRPNVGGTRGGKGVHSNGPPQKLPLVGGTKGTGVHRRQMPSLSAGDGNGMGIHAQQGRGGAIYDWMHALWERLRRVRVCCGDWSRVLGPSVTEKIGVTGVFLDPPYSSEAGRDPSLYSAEDLDVAHQVREWALANGDNPRLRIALCGYEGEHQMPASWRCIAWKANGGYGSSRRDGSNENRARERIWFSPHCLEPEVQQDLFAAAGGGR